MILALIASSLGTRSAFTKFSAKAFTSTPEPAPNDVLSFWAFALLAAAVAAGVLASAEAVAELRLELVDEVVVAIEYFSYRWVYRRES